MVRSSDRVTYALENQALRVELDFRSDRDFFKMAGMHGGGIAPTSVSIDTMATGGGRFRSSKRLTRSLDFPISVGGSDRQELEDKLRQLVAVFQDRFSTPYLVADHPNGSQYEIEAHYQSGFDYQWGSEATDGKTIVRLPLVLLCPSPYWTSRQNELFVTRSSSDTRGLIRTGSGGLSRLRIASSSASGSKVVVNRGDIEALPVWTVQGPGKVFSASRAIDGKGFTLRYVISEGETVTIDCRTKRVTTSLDPDANLYDYMDPLPKFFSIPPGAQGVSNELEGAGPSSVIVMRFTEQRELIF